MTVDPVRAAPLLARDLENRPRAFAAACGGPVGSLPPLPYDPALLAAVRRRLGAMEPGSMALPRLAALLLSWGPDAGPAVPELLAALPAYPGSCQRCWPPSAGPSSAARWRRRSAPWPGPLRRTTGSRLPALSTN
ncbi:hypothetical protein AAGT00_30825 [Streptomyces cavourensis]